MAEHAKTDTLRRDRQKQPYNKSRILKNLSHDVVQTTSAKHHQRAAGLWFLPLLFVAGTFLMGGVVALDSWLLPFGSWPLTPGAWLLIVCMCNLSVLN